MSELTEFPLTTAAQMPEADWTAKNPELAQFQMGIESDTGKCKVNFGPPTRWNSLEYWNPAGGVQIATTTVQTNVGTKQALLPAVPAGKKRNITVIFPRGGAGDYSEMTGALSFGFGASANDFSAGIDPSTALGDGFVAPVSNLTIAGTTSQFIGAAGDVFGCIFSAPSVAPDVDIDVHYYDVDA